MDPMPLRHRPLAGGFTLVELLVATGVFVLGFAAVFALFLSGVRFRKLADDTAKTVTLASTVTAELYLDSGSEGTTGPCTPLSYDGNGRYRASTTDVEEPSVLGMDTRLFTYTGIPGSLFRFDGTSDITGDQDPFATALATDVIALCPGVPVGTYGELNRHLRVYSPAQLTALGTTDQQAVAFRDELLKRGIAMRYRAVVIRQPRWLNP